MSNGCVLVTGGAGYIGSHVALALLDAGWSVVVVDNLATGLRTLIPAKARFVYGDAGNVELMSGLLQKYRCDAVLHFAGSTVVPDSVADPLAYYHNNTAVSRALIAACVTAQVRRLVFSSTAAVYGNPARLPVDEAEPPRPITPHGTSTLMTEMMLRDVAAVAPFRYVALRYFNVAGADPLRRSGQSTPDATHLVKVVCEVAAGKRDGITVFGADYDTPDGTCVRDFIHVTDLAAAHLAALDHLMAGGDSEVLNCGYGRGFSVRQIVTATERLVGRPLNVTIGPRRRGDIVSMVADTARLRAKLNWQPRYDDIEAIVGSALAWEGR